MTQTVPPESKDLPIVPGHPGKIARIAVDLPGEWRERLILCLTKNHDVFDWSVQEVRGISPRIIEHG